MSTAPLEIPEPRVRILIADDQPFIRKLVRSTLEAHPDFEVCGKWKTAVKPWTRLDK